MSLRLYNELEAVQKKDAQLEWENEVLREKTQELEVARQVLQAEVEKSREVRALEHDNFTSKTPHPVQKKGVFLYVLNPFWGEGGDLKSISLLDCHQPPSLHIRNPPLRVLHSCTRPGQLSPSSPRSP